MANPFAAAFARDVSPLGLALSVGLRPYHWQAEVMSMPEDADVLIRKGRQVGFSTLVAALSISHVLGREPDGHPRTAVLASPSMRQSARLVESVGYWMRRLGEDGEAALDADNATTIRTRSGNSIVALPGGSGQARGYRATLLVVDELGYIDDDYWHGTLRPMTLLGGRTIAGGTPSGKRGVLHDLWETEDEVLRAAWRRVRVRTGDVLPADRVEALRQELGPAFAAAELDAEFTDGAGGVLFHPDVLAGLVDDRFEALDLGALGG